MASSSDDSTIDWLKFGYDVYNSRQTPKVSYSQPPMTPEQRDLFNYAIGRIKSLPDTARDLYPTTSYYATHAPTIDVNRLKAGYTGYRGPGQPDEAWLSGVLKGQGQQPKPAPMQDYSNRHPDAPLQGSGLYGNGGGPRRGGGPMNDIGGTNQEGIPQPRIPVEGDVSQRTQNPRGPGAGSMFGGTQPPAGMSASDGKWISEHYDWLAQKFAEFKQDHPMWWKAGQAFAAFTGVPGTIAAAWISHMANSGGVRPGSGGGPPPGGGGGGVIPPPGGGN